MEFKTQTFTVSDLYNWHRGGELNLSPTFQRRLVWSGVARSYLIDTVARGLPMPKIFYRMQIHPDEVKSVREIVDGQQRLDALFSYIDGRFPVYRSHGSFASGKRFAQLTAEQQSLILSYDITADLLIGASDGLVFQIFARINSYGIRLNAQEKRNAEFAGVFKHTCYELGTTHLEFWRRNGILSNENVARMDEAELTSELVIAMMGGLQDKKKSINSYYQENDDRFPEQKRMVKQFERVLEWIENNVGDLKETAFARRAMFYSLFVAVADTLYGIPKGLGPLRKAPALLTRPQRAITTRELERLSDAALAQSPPPRLVEFAVASSRQTDNLRPRRIRHRAISNALRAAL